MGRGQGEDVEEEQGGECGSEGAGDMKGMREGKGEVEGGWGASECTEGGKRGSEGKKDEGRT